VNTASLADPGALGASPDALGAARLDSPGGVQIDHLTVRFGSRTVLDDLSLTIQRGELLTVLGRSGCGKTTLLRFIAGFIEADGLSGTLTVAGHDLTVGEKGRGCHDSATHGAARRPTFPGQT